MERFLDWIERTGNKLPHPFWIFIYLTGSVLLLSLVFGLLEVSVTHPVTGVTVTVQNLISRHGLQKFVLNMVDNFAHFAPMGLMLVMLMGVSIAVHTGLLETLLGRMTRVPDALLFPIIVVTGIMGNLASDAGIVVVPPLAAVAFKKTGKNPLAGIILGYAACTAGFTATLIPRGTDVLLAGFTNEALEDPNLHVGAAANLYFMIASVFMLALVMSWVGKKYTIPACGEPEVSAVDQKIDAATKKKQTKGLRWALLSILIFTGLVLMTLIPEDGLLRYNVEKIEKIELREASRGAEQKRIVGTTATTTKDGQKIYTVTYDDERIVLKEGQIEKKKWRDGATVHVYVDKSVPARDPNRVIRLEIMPDPMRGPFFMGMVTILFFFFAIPGIVYGVKTGRITKMADIPAMMSKSVKSMSGLIVLILIIGQFVAFFQWSNLDRVVAISGARLLNDLQVQGPLLMAVTVLVVSFLNIFLGSSAAKWAIFAPILVPMFMYLDSPISPAVTQLVYRLGDSITNGISPLYPYFPLALAWVKEYRKDAGIGTLIRLLLPYALFTGIAWILLLVLWYFLGIPVGPSEGMP
jgi:aminobenzoyl-glutamate transport protein